MSFGRRMCFLLAMIRGRGRTRISRPSQFSSLSNRVNTQAQIKPLPCWGWIPKNSLASVFRVGSESIRGGMGAVDGQLAADDEGVVAGGFEGAEEAGEDILAGVEDGGGFAVHEARVRMIKFLEKIC